MGVPEQPPCVCEHSHEIHQHYRRGTDCGHLGCDCRAYRPAQLTRGGYIDRLAVAHRTLAEHREEIANLKQALMRSRLREEHSERSLRNFVALAPFSGSRWRFTPRPAIRIPQQRSA
jgi:hypothetical protein